MDLEGPYIGSRHHTDIPALVARQRELTGLRRVIEVGRRGIVITGDAGVGKTLFVRVFATLVMDKFPGGITYLSALTTPNPSLPSRPLRPHPTIVDDADSLSHEAVSRLRKQLVRPRWNTLIQIGDPYRLATPQDFVLTLFPVTLYQVEEHFSDFLRTSSVTFDRILTRFGDDPYVVSSVLSQLRSGSSWLEVSWNAGFTYAGILGPDGRPLHEPEINRSPLIATVSDVNTQLLDSLGRRPESWYDLSPRKFEEVVAEMLNQRGYTVTLTPETADGGFDIYAAKKEFLGEFLYLVECKRYTLPHKVGVQVVRSLRGVLDEQHAVGAAIVTTSYFTEPARSFQSEFEHQLKLHDYLALQQWLQELRKA